MPSEKMLYPVDANAPRPCSIHLEAREAAELAMAALETLYSEDPFVFAALVELLNYGQVMIGGHVLANKRQALAEIRQRAHDLKIRAVNQTRSPRREAMAESAGVQ